MIRAMVLVDSEHWYVDDGTLTKTFCEQTEDHTKIDPDECCACDEAKYKVILFLVFFSLLNQLFADDF